MEFSNARTELVELGPGIEFESMLSPGSRKRHFAALFVIPIALVWVTSKIPGNYSLLILFPALALNFWICLIHLYKFTVTHNSLKLNLVWRTHEIPWSNVEKLKQVDSKRELPSWNWMSSMHVITYKTSDGKHSKVTVVGEFQNRSQLIQTIENRIAANRRIQ